MVAKKQGFLLGQVLKTRLINLQMIIQNISHTHTNTLDVRDFEWNDDVSIGSSKMKSFSKEIMPAVFNHNTNK